MAKIERIIEYQDIQRTPVEVLDELGRVFHEKDIDRVLVLYSDGESQYYIAGSAERGYQKAHILWDLEVFKGYFLDE